MKKILTILLFSLILPALSIADTWEPITNLPLDLKPRRVFVYDNGYVVSGIVPKNTGDQFGAYKYDGQSYQLLYRGMYYNVSFDVSHIGSYAISYNSPPYYTTATAFNSIDNTTWGIQTSMGQPIEILSRVFIFDTSRFYMEASNFNNPKMFGTILPNNDFSLSTIDGDLLALKFINQTFAFSIMSSQAANGNQNIRLCKTTNAGDAWNIVLEMGQKPSNLSFPCDISFIDNIHGYMNMDSLLYFTVDGGLSWSLISSFSGSILDAYFTDSNFGYAVCKTEQSTYQLIKTANHGQSWNLEMNIGILPVETYGYSGHILHGNGNTVMLISDSTVYRRTSITETGEINSGIPKNYSLKQNYPNPFNPSTVIKYSLLKQTMVKIIIYDISGKEISRLINNVQTAGNHEITFNGNNLSSGTYFYKIEAGDYTDTKKMILIK